ncbi:MFS transporter [Novosphingobium sp. Chol11]|jgi:MFS family permease|uniref:MFS transporter n=1 Tax=Novosphingobium sp. Chol11 TaxID=1385763 RepID=UPI000BE46DD7|nr:MFS transporter [Novosphingobium sp. Chol11]
MHAIAESTTGRPSHSRSYAFYMLVLLLLASTLSNADRHVLSVLLPSIKADFGLSNSMLGLIAGPVFIVPYVLFTMPLARLADRWSRRSVLAGAVFVWSVAAAACGMAVQTWQLVSARLVVGMGEAGGGPASQSLVATLFDKRRNLAMGVLASGIYCGIVVGLTGGAAIAEAAGWRMAFLALAAPGLPLALLIWWTGPTRLRKVAAAAPAGPKAVGVFARCIRIRSLILLALGMGTFNIYGYGAATWMPSYFVASHGMSMIEAGAWMGVGAACGGVVGSIASGAIVETLIPCHKSWQLRIPALGLLLSWPLSLIVFTLPGGTALHIGSYPVPAVALLSIVTSFLTSLWMGPSYAALARLVPADLRAQTIGLLAVVINIMGSLFGPPIAGLVSDLLAARFGLESLRYSLLTMSGLILIGGLTVWRAASHYGVEVVEN